MGKPVSLGQSHNLMSVLANNTAWDELDSSLVQEIINDPRQAGSQFTAFLKNGGRVMIGQQGIVAVDRTHPFDSTTFEGLGKGWKIIEQDERSLALTELDLSKVQLATCLKSGEEYLKGEQKLARLKETSQIRLDALFFYTLWKNQHLIPEAWKQMVNGYSVAICFDGTILGSPRGYRYVLYLHWCDSEWSWDYRWLESAFDADDPSAVLAS